MMRVAVCLQTADRSDYTARTLASFAAHNDLKRFALFHGDDASATTENRDLAHAYGFKTLVRTKARIGCLPLRTALIVAAARHADWILLLENDIDSVRPFPWALLHHVASIKWLYTLRLFGAFKGPNQTDPCHIVNKWKPEKPVKWKALGKSPEPAEYGLIHWSAQPSVTRTRPLVDLHCSGIRELRLKTARVVDNVMVHIGDVRTHQARSREAVAC